MARQEMTVKQLGAHVTGVWNDWLLLTAGSFTDKRFNSMTVSWGTMGVMWEKPVVQVVVRPHRYTYEFMEEGSSFTVCAFGKEFRPALSVLGTKSGREIDKVDHSGLTPIASTRIDAPGYEEASLIIECRKVAFGDFDPAGFVDSTIDGVYNQDYHRWYMGEMVAIYGTEEYFRSR